MTSTDPSLAIAAQIPQAFPLASERQRAVDSIATLVAAATADSGEATLESLRLAAEQIFGTPATTKDLLSQYFDRPPRFPESNSPLEAPRGFSPPRPCCCFWG